MKMQFPSFRLLSEKARDLHGFLSRARRSETEDIAVAASMLQISEFRFFHLAHEQWFGQNVPDRLMEHIFMSYILDDNVPYWVRHLTRKVLALHNQGKLDPRKFGIIRPQGTPELTMSGIRYTILMAIVLVLFCILITGHVPLQ